MNKSTMKMDSFKLLSVTTIVAICFGFGDSVLVTVPHNTVAVVGQTAYFNCSSNISYSKIQWHDKYDKNIYVGGRFLNPYERFRIVTDNSSGSCNLVIPNVRRDDAGSYYCKDNDGFGDKRSAELVVLDGNPVCGSDMMSDGIVGPNNCNIDPEDVRLSCSATYRGNIPPILRWTRLGDSGPINSGRTMCKNSTNRVDCNLTIKADSLQLDGSSYICHTELTTNINCTSDAIGIIYSFNDFRITERSMNDELSCKVNSSEQCNKRWIWNAFDGSSTVIVDQSNVTADRSGIYRCESECNIRGKRCAVSAMMVYIPSDKRTEIDGPMVHAASELSSSAAHSTALTVVLVILAVLLVICVISLLVCCMRWRKLKVNQKHNSKDPEAVPLSSTTNIQGNNHGEPNETNDDGSFDETDCGPRQENDSEKLLKLQNEKESLTNKLNTSNGVIEELRKQLTNRESEWSKKSDELNSEVKELKEKLEMAERKNAAQDKEVKRLVERNGELGRSLVSAPKEPIEYKVGPHETIKTLASQGPKNLGVCGVAILDKELFVISDSQPEIEVYAMETFKHSRTIPLHGVMDPGDIVACDKNKRIYIVDWTERNLQSKMLRLETNGKEDKERLSVEDDECRLFVTRDSNVLVTFYRSRKIVEYTPDWGIVFQTKIKGDIYPIHSVKLSNGLLAICHGKKDESTHRVCIVNDDGRLLKSFGGRKGAGSLQVNFPTYLAVDRSDNILVADRDNRRVLVLNSRLELPAVLLAETDKLRRPRVLLLDERNNRLVVADCNEQIADGQVLIFNVK